MYSTTKHIDGQGRTLGGAIPGPWEAWLVLRGLRTLGLRSVLYPAVDVSYVIPIAGVLLIGGAFYGSGDIGTVVAAALYLRMLAAPLDVVLTWVEALQSSGICHGATIQERQQLRIQFGLLCRLAQGRLPQ